MPGRPMFFINLMNPPPEGYFFEADGERITGARWLEFEPKLVGLMRRHRIDGLPESVLARYMAPHLSDPGRYIKGPNVRKADIRGPEALANSTPYLTRPVVPMDRIERRVATCTSCPSHYRAWCPTCVGHIQRMKQAFGDRRPGLPCDVATGVCRCTKAYEYAICSVEYGVDEKVWPGAPETCWRYHDV